MPQREDGRLKKQYERHDRRCNRRKEKGIRKTESVWKHVVGKKETERPLDATHIIAPTVFDEK